jgi:hypothetical protein
VNAARLLSLLRPLLAGSGARWTLAGGFALAAWGGTRTTLDLDLLVEETGRGPILRDLAAEGFETLLDSEGFTNLLHPDRRIGRLDLIWVEGETARKILAAAVERPGPDGIPVLVPAPEHLVAMKVKAVRNDPTRVFRDAEDLRYLLRLPGIDENDVRATFERAGLLDLHARLTSET